MTALNRILPLACAALLASCNDFYQTDGRAQVFGSSMYARPQRVVYATPKAVAPPAPQDSNIAYYVPANTVPRGVREIHIVKKAPAVQQPSPHEFLKHAPAPEPEPMVEDHELEPIPPELLEQPGASSSVQVPAGASTL